MNKQRTPSQQFLLFFALAWAGMMMYQQYLGPKTPGGTQEVRPAPKTALVEAFAGINPEKPPVLDKTAATTEVKKLTDEITKNGTDGYSYWARLRAGLLQQYALKDEKAAISRYDEVIHHGATDDVAAQAAYQKGDLLWRKSTASGGPPSEEGARALEALVHKGRGSSAFLDHQIYIPATPHTDPLALPAAWQLVKIRDLHGNAQNPNPNGLLERVDTYYSYKPFHKIFDKAAELFGNNPTYSYGLAILVFAFITRLVLQPLNKKQYESMKGMAVIAPEMKKIQDKYKNKKDQESQMKMMNEIRALQKRHGVNPMLGCGLAMVQIPVFIFVVSPFIQNYEAKLELVGASFFWINNLARPDIPLLVLYAFSQFASMRLSSTPPADEQQRQMQVMMLFFPFVVPFFLLTWPSAFTLYWMMFNFMSMFFQYRMMKSADPTKRLWNILIKQPLIPKITLPEGDTLGDAVPPRPKSGRSGEMKVGAVKSLSPGDETGNGRSGKKNKNELIEAKNGFNGSLPIEAKNGASPNGRYNGTSYDANSDGEDASSDNTGSSADGSNVENGRAGGINANGASSGIIRTGTGKTRRKRRY
jgi:YidC/Oxa1 family membrane protein insertase